MSEKEGRDASEPISPAAPAANPLPPQLDPRAGTDRQLAGPEVVPGKRRRATRALAWIAGVTAVLVLLAAAGGYAYLRRLDGQVKRIDVFTGITGDKPAPTVKDAQNILIVGSDTREGLAAGEGTQGRGAAFVSGQRSDTVILAHLYGNSDKAQLVSFPRDSYVTIPAYTNDSGEQVAAREDKLNRAFFEGGPALLISTIQGLTGLTIDNYLQIDFESFLGMVEALDGVEVCLSEPAKEPRSGIDLPAGRQTIKGDQALAFVRQRFELPRGDLDRIERQQQFIAAIVRKTLSAGTLLNVRKLNDVFNVATASVRVDKSLSAGELRKLALRFSKFQAGGVTFSTIPVTGNAKIKGEDVVLLDKPKLAELFASLKRDEPPVTSEPEAPAGPTNPLTVQPGAIPVQVFNGAGVSSLGRKAYDDLEAAGFQVTGSPGDHVPSAAGTVVLHGRAQTEAARTLVAAIPGATAQLTPSLTRTLEVVVGSEYTGTVPIEVSAPAATAPPAVPEGQPEVTTAAEDPCTA